MSAYENPQPIRFETTGAGQAWANAAAAIGKNIGNAIEKRAERLRRDLEKENKQALALKKKRIALSAEGGRLLKENLAKMKGLDEDIKNAYIKEFKAGWEAYTKSQTSTSIEEIESLQPALKKFEHFRAVSSDQIADINDYTQRMAIFIDQVVKDGPGVPNTVDLYYAGNNDLLKAADIETGGIEEGEGREVYVNDKGDTVIKYTYLDEEGKSKSFDLNVAELPLDEVLTVPDLDNVAMKTIDNANIFVDGKLAAKYQIIDPETNQPEIETKTTTDEDGNIITESFQKVDTQSIISQFESAGREAVGNMTYEQKVSLYKNTLAPQNPNFKSGILSYDSKTGDFSDEYKNKKTGEPISIKDLAAQAKNSNMSIEEYAAKKGYATERQIFDEALAEHMGNMARMKVAEATQDYYKKSITKKSGKDSKGGFYDYDQAYKAEAPIIKSSFGGRDANWRLVKGDENDKSTWRYTPEVYDITTSTFVPQPSSSIPYGVKNEKGDVIINYGQLRAAMGAKLRFNQ